MKGTKRKEQKENNTKQKEKRKKWEHKQGFDGLSMVTYERDFLPLELLHELRAGLDDYDKFKLFHLKIGKKEIPMPRLQTAFGNPHTSYRFSRIKVDACPWDTIPAMDKARQYMEGKGMRFSYVLVNMYRGGNDHIGWHADDEKDLYTGAPIYSLSIGEKREFQVKESKKDASVVWCKELENNSLVTMHYPMQEYYQHCIKKEENKIKGVRYNLTFRLMK